jgi:pimeloyl-ACP methyl ester carboxylesterase
MSATNLTFRSRLVTLLVRGAIVLGVAVLLVAMAGAAYQQIATSRDNRRFPMTGVLVPAQGHKMRLNCGGHNSQSGSPTVLPTVLFDAGLGDSSETWDLVQPAVEQFTRACSWDRPGYGWSEPTDSPRTSEQIVSEIHEMLQKANEPGPYILVGHSFGGYNQLVFQRRYPSSVVGMVFVDSSHPDQVNRFDKSMAPENDVSHWRLAGLGAHFGIPRLLGWCRDDYIFPNAPAAWTAVVPRVVAVNCRTAVYATEADEEATFRENGREAGETKSLGNLPIVVLSHDPKFGASFPPDLAVQGERLWSQMQEELRALSTHSHRIVAPGSMHYVESYHPELVIEAVRELTAQANPGK